MKRSSYPVYKSERYWHQQQPAKQGRLGITRGRALIILAAFAFFFYILTGFVFASETKPAFAEKEVTVQPGDSLWKLSVRYHEKAGMDIQELVDVLMEINDLDDAVIYPGQNIKIPVKS